MGRSQEALRRRFAEAADAAPSFVLFDDLDVFFAPLAAAAGDLGDDAPGLGLENPEASLGVQSSRNFEYQRNLFRVVDDPLRSGYT